MPRKLRVALTGDLHFDEASRFEDCKRITAWIAHDAAARGCELMLLSGDTYERKSTATERLAVADLLRMISDVMTVVLVSGNHDDPLDVELLGRLAGGRHLIQAATVPHTYAVQDPRALGANDEGEAWPDPIAVVHCLPWPRRAYLAGLSGTDAINYAAHGALQNVLRGFASKKWSEDTPSILLAHAMVRGSRTSVSQPPMVGEDFELGLEDLALAEADAVALGHIHMCQEWEINAAMYESPDGMRGPPVIYPGSPRRCTWGETEPKSYVVLTFDGRRCVDVERVPTPAGNMVHLSARWNPHAAGGAGALELESGSPEIVVGAEVRLRYDVPAEHREAARLGAVEAAAELSLRCAAASVKLEERVEVVSRVRAPEVTEAATTWDKLNAHWRARGSGPAGDRLEAVRSKLNELEGEP